MTEATRVGPVRTAGARPAGLNLGELQRFAGLGSATARIHRITRHFGDASLVRRGLTPVVFLGNEQEKPLARKLLEDFIPNSTRRLLVASSTARGAILEQIRARSLNFAGDDLIAVRDVLESMSKIPQLKTEVTPALEALTAAAAPIPTPAPAPAVEATLPVGVKSRLEVLQQTIKIVRDPLQAEAFNKKIDLYNALIASRPALINALTVLLRYAGWSDRTQNAALQIRGQLTDMDTQIASLGRQFAALRADGMEKVFLARQGAEQEARAQFGAYGAYVERMTKNLEALADMPELRAEVDKTIGRYKKERIAIETALALADRGIDIASPFGNLPTAPALEAAPARADEDLARPGISSLKQEIEAIGKEVKELTLVWTALREDLERALAVMEELKSPETEPRSNAIRREIQRAVGVLKSLAESVKAPGTTPAGSIAFSSFDHKRLLPDLLNMEEFLIDIVERSKTAKSNYAQLKNQAAEAETRLSRDASIEELRPAAADELAALLKEFQTERDDLLIAARDFLAAVDEMVKEFGVEIKGLNPPPEPAPSQRALGRATLHDLGVAGQGARRDNVAAAFQASLERFRSADSSVRTILLGADLLHQDDIQALDSPVLVEVLSKLYTAFAALGSLSKTELRRRNHDWRERLAAKLDSLSTDSRFAALPAVRTTISAQINSIRSIIAEIESLPESRISIPTIDTPRKLYDVLNTFRGDSGEVQTTLIPAVEAFLGGYRFGPALMAAVRAGTTPTEIILKINTKLADISATTPGAAAFQLDFLPEDVI